MNESTVAHQLHAVAERYSSAALVLLTGAFFASQSASAAGDAALDVEPLKRWVENQGAMRSLTCAFTQEKKLRTLRKPLVASGRIWYRAPDDFRWELGEPPRTILFHSATRVTMVDVARKRAQVIRIDGEGAGGGKGGGGGGAAAGGYFDLGFPRSWAAFEESFEVVSLESRDGWMTAELSPKSRHLAKGVQSVRFVIETATQKLRQLSLDLRDRSTITTTFADAVRDAKVPDAVFEPALEGFEVREIDG